MMSSLGTWIRITPVPVRSAAYIKIDTKGMTYSFFDKFYIVEQNVKTIRRHKNSVKSAKLFNCYVDIEVSNFQKKPTETPIDMLVLKIYEKNSYLQEFNTENVKPPQHKVLLTASD